MGVMTIIELTAFSSLLIWIFGKILISVFKNKLTGSKKAGLENGGLFNFKSNNKVLYSIAIAVVALISLDIVTRVVATSMWNWLYHSTEGTFFWGLQIVIFLFIFTMSMNKDEKSKPINPMFLWTIVLILFVGLANQPNIKEYFSADDIHHIAKTSTSESNSQNIQKGEKTKGWITLLPGKWHYIDVSSRYRDIVIKPQGEIVIKKPNGTTYIERPDSKHNEVGAYGTYGFKPRGKKSVRVWVSLT